VQGLPLQGSENHHFQSAREKVARLQLFHAVNPPSLF
jgi:hypothetical protein